MRSFATIGAGNMGQAILRGAFAAGVLSPAETLVVDPDPARRASLAALGCPIDADPAAAHGCGTIMLAVKPQVFPEVAARLGTLEAPTIVISIMAGVRSERIRAALGDQARVVRVMPNTPAQLRCGMAAIASGAGAEPGDDDLARRLFEAIGLAIEVPEDMMDAVTAVSGSGPAYIFLLAEAMEEGARRLGFDDNQARVLVSQTVLGAATLLAAERGDPTALRAAVTSKGGTTAAAIESMLGAGILDAIVRGIAAAEARGRELGQ
ncbi:MAG: pyrroline-5-carboxylate reductase [Phycisphaerales bacterium]|nr:pyrroline-5-carboxylate reductase [Phycisphaerales bacterium]